MPRYQKGSQEKEVKMLLGKLGQWDTGLQLHKLVKAHVKLITIDLASWSE
jgi:hypothetical protein